MVATSDVVVLGTVVEVRDGTIEGPPGQEIEHLDALLDVQETMYGSVDESSPLKVQTLKFVSSDTEWREIGTTVLAFMRLSTDPDAEGTYYPVNDQSIYLVTGIDLQATVDADPFSKGVAKMTLDEIRVEILKATEAIEDGEVTPQTPVGG
jgi:hypothetical protein